jgi:hypothetical protein
MADMAHISSPFRLALTAAAAGALLLAGCNGDGGTRDSGGDPQGPVDTQEQAPTTVPSTVQGATGGGEGGGGGRNDPEQPQNQTPQDDPAGTGDGGNTGAGSTDDWSSETDGRSAAD